MWPRSVFIQYFNDRKIVYRTKIYSESAFVNVLILVPSKSGASPNVERFSRCREILLKSGTSPYVERLSSCRALRRTYSPVRFCMCFASTVPILNMFHFCDMKYKNESMAYIGRRVSWDMCRRWPRDIFTMFVIFSNTGIGTLDHFMNTNMQLTSNSQYYFW